MKTTAIVCAVAAASLGFIAASFAQGNDRRDFYNARGPEFQRGGFIPREFRHRQYVVNDYRLYRLGPPTRGHEWVQVGSDYVLIAIATGLIANIVFSR
jgi:Ni/Co efflux regulator RcnB